ncbi:hypothetical protein [Actinoplanes sichuanensis]|uniref:Uncharacterized protein n=1 Tax=Actinoplanes sichuanensis TaxID=512349 RepID=A0ABW4AS28_9ACTN|nr:hypothetical protein [Actinoplanes sichuanensis]
MSRILRGMVAVAALAGVMMVGQPASAAAQRSCTVSASNKWGCNTAPMWLAAGANPHAATLNIYSPATPNPPGEEADPPSSFIVIRNVGTGAEVLRDNQFRSAEHNIWMIISQSGNYRAELHCPWGCAGATLYFDS